MSSALRDSMGCFRVLHVVSDGKDNERWGCARMCEVWYETRRDESGLRVKRVKLKLDAPASARPFLLCS
jgi:hypothetical protein